MEGFGLAELSALEVAVVTTAIALVAALLTAVIMKSRDRALANRARASSQAWNPGAAIQQDLQTRTAPGAAPIAIPGYCPNCGMATKQMAIFCDRCGRRLLQG